MLDILPQKNSDSAWKLIFDHYLKDCLYFCHPQAFRVIDWSRGYENLDKELLKLQAQAVVGHRVVDHLAKAYLSSGEEAWIVIHLEAQSHYDQAFAERMFSYWYRLFDYYKKPLLSIGILVDTNIAWRPQVYEHTFLDCGIRFSYPIVKIKDFTAHQESLEASDNPFASVILTQLRALETPAIAKDYFQQKLALTRRLYSKGFTKEQILTLYAFIDFLFRLPEAYELQYLQEIYELEVEHHMPYITSAERIGIQKGLQQGLQQGEANILLTLLKHRFTFISQEHEACIRQADAATLLLMAERILDAKTIEDIFN